MYWPVNRKTIRTRIPKIRWTFLNSGFDTHPTLPSNKLRDAARKQNLQLAHGLYVLIYQNRVSIRINNHKASRASRAFVCFYDHVYATIFELTLQLSNVREFSEWLSIATPARVEGENVLIEHPLEQPNSVVAILHNQPILQLISCENCKAQLFVKELRRLDIFYSQANREVSQFHNFLLRRVPE